MKKISKIIVVFDDGTTQEISTTPDWTKPYDPYDPYHIPKSPLHPPIQEKSGCNVCGMVFDGAMGYVCSRANCPSGVTYTSGGSSGSSC